MSAAQTLKQTVLVAVDDSPYSEYAAMFYLERIHRDANHVVVVHTMEFPDHQHSKNVQKPGGLREVRAVETGRAKKVEDKFFDLFKAAGVINLRARTETGRQVSQMICEVAAEVKATLVVMGTRGLKGKKAVASSVSEAVVHKANCPVLVCSMDLETKSRADSLLREGRTRRSGSSPPGLRMRSSTFN